MKFVSIKIKEGMFSRYIDFSNKKNLIYSTENSCGKTTLMRLLFYSIGYNIPSLEGIEFSKLEIETLLEIDNVIYKINRIGNVITFSHDGFNTVYTLPSDFHLILNIYYKNKNINILNNVLGCIYLDQEKGWTLLNRGVVIGSYRFNIDEFISGLSDIDCNDLINEKKVLEQNISKYNRLLEFAGIKEELVDSPIETNLTYYEKLSQEVLAYKLKVNYLKRELEKVDKLIETDETFVKYLENMLISINHNGETILVTRENLNGYNDNLETIKVKKNILTFDLQETSNKYKQKSIELENYLQEKNNLVDGLSNIDIIENKLKEFNIDSGAIDAVLKKSKDRKKMVNEEIKTKLRSSEYISIINDWIKKFGEILGLSNKSINKSDYIFTDDLKSKSGANLQKLVFAFKMAYVKCLEQKLNTKLPIVLDSPYGKELSQSNFKLMMNVIDKYFNDNQIIIASIYDIEVDKKHTLKDRLIEKK